MPEKAKEAKNALATLLESNPQQTYSLGIKKILALCGDGRLGDGNPCSLEFQGFLRIVPSSSLFAYVETCLVGTKGFDDSGYVLQDVVNEFGRRLDYEVTNGLYRGKQNAIGYDGIWLAPNKHAIVVEVKTTDTYRMNLDDLAGYREALLAQGKITETSSILLVVGRQDTGDLEAQVRGSRHAWTIRIISVDALARLVALKEETEDETTERIHELLVPFEYTRLDKIIDIAFTAAKDAGTVAEPEEDEDEEGKPPAIPKSYKQTHTSKQLVEKLRQSVLERLGKREGTQLLKRTRALYWSPDRKVRVACTFSKKFKRGNYWYAYHPAWDKFLSEGEKAYFVLGCVDKNEAFVIPRGWIADRLKLLHQTDLGKKTYWHIHLEPTGLAGSLVLKLHKAKSVASLKEFEI